MSKEVPSNVLSYDVGGVQLEQFKEGSAELNLKKQRSSSDRGTV